MLSVDLLVRAPLRVLGDECVFAANYFSFKVRCQTRVIFRQAWEVSAALVVRLAEAFRSHL